MSYEGKNIVKNSVTLNEVTKTNADSLPNRNGKLLNVDGELHKDDGSKLVKLVNNQSKQSLWGLTYSANTLPSEWVTTGTASVSIDPGFAEIGVNSFRVDLTGAGDAASIDIKSPRSAVDIRYNKATISYLLFDGGTVTEPVVATFKDWNGNPIGRVNLPATGGTTPISSNLRYSYAEL